MGVSCFVAGYSPHEFRSHGTVEGHPARSTYDSVDVAMPAFLRDFVATPPKVLGVICPADSRILCHLNFLFYCRLPSETHVPPLVDQYEWRILRYVRRIKWDFRKNFCGAAQLASEKGDAEDESAAKSSDSHEPGITSGRFEVALRSTPAAVPLPLQERHGDVHKGVATVLGGVLLWVR